ncbi:hypothetical protein ACIPRI_15160 [Variovorax sp. LARHSF232]
MADAIYCFDTASVRFAVYPDGKRIVAEIEENPLRDIFGARGGGDTLIDAYFEHAEQIDALALEKHRRAPGRPIVLAISDFRLQ